MRSASTPMNGAAMYPAILLALTIPTISAESVSSSVSQPTTTVSAHGPWAKGVWLSTAAGIRDGRGQQTAASDSDGG